MHADAEAIHELLDRTNGPQIVVAHSYGAIPVTQVAHELPQVLHIIYVAAFQLDVGESLLGVFGGRIPPWLIVNGQSATADRAIEVFTTMWSLEPLLGAKPAAAKHLCRLHRARHRSGVATRPLDLRLL
jgi:pimeloyl-ACP methyl ester carboxylesterase